MLEPVGGEVDQPLREPDRGGVGEPAEHHVRHVAELAAYGLVQLGHGVAVDGRPPRRHAVDELGAVSEHAGVRRSADSTSRTGVGSVIDV